MIKFGFDYSDVPIIEQLEKEHKTAGHIVSYRFIDTPLGVMASFECSCGFEKDFFYD